MFFIILLWGITACTKFEEDEGSLPTQDFPDQESWDNNIFFTRDSIRRAVLTAGYIAKYTKKKYTLLREGVKVDFYDEIGNLKSVLNSEEGKVLDDKQNMYAYKNVVVQAVNGTTLYTEELYWDNKAEKIISEVPVKITTPTDTLFGDTFRSDPDLVEYEITNAHGISDKTLNVRD
jgi:LPS export ABC transporter protein LptC